MVCLFFTPNPTQLKTHEKTHTIPTNKINDIDRIARFGVCFHVNVEFS